MITASATSNRLKQHHLMGLPAVECNLWSLISIADMQSCLGPT